VAFGLDIEKDRSLDNTLSMIDLLIMIYILNLLASIEYFRVRRLEGIDCLQYTHQMILEKCTYLKCPDVLFQEHNRLSTRNDIRYYETGRLGAPSTEYPWKQRRLVTIV